MMKNKYASHDINLDIIRCVAVITVFQVHFLLNIGFYKLEIGSAETLLMTFMATVFRVCVPLFMMLTGFLMCHKPLSSGYYKGVFRIGFTYLVASVICILILRGLKYGSYTFSTALLAITGFTASKYSWYVEMYFGFFLLIPFINMIWEKLDSRKKRLALLITLALLSIAPKLLNSFDFKTDGWFAQPSLSNSYNPLIPDWWANALYPLTYYFIGAYICEEKVKLNKVVNVLLLAVAAAFFTATNFYRSRNGLFVSGAPVDWGGVGCTVISVLLFILIKNLKFTSKLPSPIKYCISRISYLSLTMYLVSAAVDTLCYDVLMRITSNPAELLTAFPLIIGMVFVITAIVSEIADRLIINPLTKLSNKAYDGCANRLARRKQAAYADKDGEPVVVAGEND